MCQELKAPGPHHTDIAGGGITGAFKRDRTSHDDIENNRSPARPDARRFRHFASGQHRHGANDCRGAIAKPCAGHDRGYAAFVPGLAIVYFHNRWTGGWPVLITVMGWLSLVVGFLRIVFPTQLAALATTIAPSATGFFPVIAVIFLLIGGFLSFKAYKRE
jgi:hypothetical protein